MTSVKVRIVALTIALLVIMGAVLDCSKRNPVKRDEPTVTWARAYGSDQIDIGRSVAVSSTGGYLVAGYTRPMTQGSADICLLATDAKGDSLWSRVWGGPEDDVGWSAAATDDGGYLVAGWIQTLSANQTEMYIVKVDASGGTIWERTLVAGEQQWASSAAKTDDGGFVVVGGISTVGMVYYCAYLVKLNSSGDTLWTKKYNYRSRSSGYAVAQIRDGGYLVAGYTFRGDGYDGYVVKTDSVGDTVWTRTIGGEPDDVAYSVVETIDGDYVFAGYTESSGAGRKDVWVVKVSPFGGIVWERTFGGPQHDYGYSVAATADGGCVVVGTLHAPDSAGRDMYLIRLDVAGDSLWTRRHGTSADEEGYSVACTHDGGYIVTGTTHSSAIGHGTYADIYVVKTDANGEVAD
jgi:hypothetical protein